MSDYYLLDRSSLPGRWINKRLGTNVPPVDWYYWRKGTHIPDTEIIPNPIRFDLKPYSEWASDNSHHMPAILKASVPLFRDDFVEALFNTGIDNFITYNCEILDSDTGKKYTNYKAINVIGMISAADMNKSKATIHPNGPPIIDVDFDELVKDDEKASDALLFRLAESNNGIFVYKSVKNIIESLGFDDVAFYEDKDVAL